MQKALLDSLAQAVVNIDKAKQLPADAKAPLKKAMIPLLKDGMLMGQSGAPATIAKLPIKEARAPATAK